jgi:hypothetical protein
MHLGFFRNKLVKIEGIFMHHHVNQDEFLMTMISIISKILED